MAFYVRIMDITSMSHGSSGIGLRSTSDRD